MKQVEERKGFTLVEVIVVVVVLGVISGIGVVSMLSSADALAFLTLRVGMDQSADLAMSRMANEIRRLRNDESMHADTNSNQFRFFDVNGIDINYYLNGNNLMRNTDILAGNVSNINFTYYDDNGNVLATPTLGIGTSTNIRSIKILLTLQSGNYQLNYQSQVRPRNLRHLSYKFK
jgi:prepilin-type N-terminal cleavage/methylation domain-containing protein